MKKKFPHKIYGFFTVLAGNLFYFSLDFLNENIINISEHIANNICNFTLKYPPVSGGAYSVTVLVVVELLSGVGVVWTVFDVVVVCVVEVEFDLPGSDVVGVELVLLDSDEVCVLLE